MSKELLKHGFLKTAFFALILILFGLVGIELISFALLKTVLSPREVAGKTEDKLVDNFPAQFRMNTKELRATFPWNLPTPRIGNFMAFPFDPVLGFRPEGSQEWYPEKPSANDSRFLIVTFGGSTTVMDNWPKYLIQYAKKEAVVEELLVLNVGCWGFMTFQEKIYFSTWVLPQLRDMGLKPNLVLSLDGVNDVWSRIGSHTLAKRAGSEKWFNHYHGYHQQLDQDMKELGTVSKAMGQLISNLSRAAYEGTLVTYGRLFPYTLRALLETAKKLVQGSSKSDHSKNRKRPELVKLPLAIEEKIVSGFRASLMDFFASSRVRKIPFVAYLQPVLLAEYYPFKVTSEFIFPSFDYFSAAEHKENKFFTRLYPNIFVKTYGIYQKSEIVYDSLNSEYPGHFKSLASLFEDERDVEELYSRQDSVHYGQKGKELISHAVIIDLIKKGYLHRKSSKNK